MCLSRSKVLALNDGVVSASTVKHGDHDMAVPFVGTEAWVGSLGYAIIEKRRPWFVGGQIAGYTRKYDHNLTFATFKGAGHTVPEYKPREALAAYARWLDDEPL
eukprot:Gb_15431 [translate_table: standard]